MDADDPALRAALLISVWMHDGAVVARIHGFGRLDEPQVDLGLSVGEDALLAAVAEWLASVRRSRGHGPGDKYQQW